MKNGKVKGILIDPTLKSVTEVEYEGDYREIKKLLGIESPIDARGIEGTNPDDRETLYFDDEFLLKGEDDEPRDYFVLNGIGSPIGGRGLIVGTDGEGDDVSTKLTVELVKGNVEFKRLRVNGWNEGYTDEDYEHPWMGKMTRIVGSSPKFEEAE